MYPFTVSLRDIGLQDVPLAGGKAANLGELTKINGILVPDGFCISTEAYKRTTADIPGLSRLLEALSALTSSQREKIAGLSEKIRSSIETAAIPPEIFEEIDARLDSLGDMAAFAVRSSATAEDLPTASFAGQQDTYLNLTGKRDILRHVSKCWASLFTSRAVIYRMQNGFDHRRVHLAVVIQKMVSPRAAGTLFTADPLTSNRKKLSIEAVPGLGEALVSGLVNPDLYTVHGDTIAKVKIAAGKHSQKQVLTDPQILELAETGRRIEAHFNQPVDMEWCLAGDSFYIVQSRPITTLFPIPGKKDTENHVFVSVGHQQMMTDPMKPLGLSLWQLIAFRPMSEAAGRLFIDITPNLSSIPARTALLHAMGQHDPLIHDALRAIIDRDDFLPSLPPPASVASPPSAPPSPLPAPTTDIDPALISDLIANSQNSIAELQQNIRTKSGLELFDFIEEDIRQLKRRLTDSQSLTVIMAGMNAAAWLNEKMKEWLGESATADTLAQSVPGNITAEMGLALADVADIIRPYPGLIDFLRQANDDNFLAGLSDLRGGQQAKDAIDDYLRKYGMRCAGEIDITRMRWAEKPTALIPVILSNIENLEPDAARRKFEAGRQRALQKSQDLVDRLRRLPGGDEKAEQTMQMVGLLRRVTGYREYPKYDIVNHIFLYKAPLLKEAQRLLEKNIIEKVDDIGYFRFEELREVVRTGWLDYRLIERRKAEHSLFKKMTPPRVITSDGEVVTGSYRHGNLPVAAIPGLPVSSGVIEGRARVILDMEAADLQAGDILVTTFTDPSWTPLFVSIKGLVTEVGGLMTHGAVIAREYGLPAVVGVVDATRLIPDGQRVRVNGTDGYVEIL